MPARALIRLARPLGDPRGDPRQYDPILDRIGDASIVMIGEASHGTHEFYLTRAVLSARLILERGFAAVVAEADWPDAYRINRFVRCEGSDRTAREALGDFRRFPTWMWRNPVVERFASWLRAYNHGRAPTDRVGFYGMDLYSMYRSIEKILEYLDAVDPEAASRVRQRYACFADYGGEAQIYGRSSGLGLSPSCEQQAIEVLVQMRERSEELVRRDGLAEIDEQFFVERNAALVCDAERYYRSMFRSRVNTWNLRDQHMMATCEAVREHLGAHGRGRGLVIWAHNSHLGDARATEWAATGQVNLGQLMRERHGQDCVNVGFTSHTGTVTAASNWDGPAERKRLLPSRPDSWERRLHELGHARACLITRDDPDALGDELLTRAVGVIYRPETERMSHYFAASLGAQFDVVVHEDETRALSAFERWPAEHEEHEPAETFPFGL